MASSSLNGLLCLLFTNKEGILSENGKNRFFYNFVFYNLAGVKMNEMSIVIDSTSLMTWLCGQLVSMAPTA